MNGSIFDACGVLLAALLGGGLILLPGYALGRLSGVLDFRALAPGRSLLCAAFLGIGLLPALNGLIIQAAGVPAAVLANGALGLAALAPVARRCWGRIGRSDVLLIFAWLGLVAYALIDFDAGSALYQPVTIIDLVKHAALTRSIVEHGLPPVDPFFARPERSGYYYYFYTLSAVLDWAGGGLVDGRAAFAGASFWTGIGLVGLIDRLLAATGLVRGASPRLLRNLTLLLLPAAGLDILLVASARLATGFWVTIPEWLNEQVLNWPSSLVWVPHHVAGTLAAWLGLLALAEVADGEPAGRPQQAAAVAVAGAAFAACAGLSVWVCLGAVATAGTWLALLVVERRWRDAGRLAAAGLLAAILAAPYLVTLLANRDGSERLLALSVRSFGPLELMFEQPTPGVLRLLLLPVNYYLAFGVFAGGAFLFWRVVGRREAHAREAGRLLTLCAAAALLIGAFLRSTILNNDLGWRVVLLAQVAALVWSVIAVIRMADGGTRFRIPGSLLVLLLLGYASTLSGLVGMRAYRLSAYPGTAINTRPEIDRDLRAAFTWADAHLPHDIVLQQSPIPQRVFDFGLYGNRRVGVADHSANLFGASAQAVAARMAEVAPIFGGSLLEGEVRRRALGAGIGALVVTEEDAPWQNPDSWVWRVRPAQAWPRVRIVRVEDLQGAAR